LSLAYKDRFLYARTDAQLGQDNALNDVSEENTADQLKQVLPTKQTPRGFEPEL
jgi:hypothetical protein